MVFWGHSSHSCKTQDVERIQLDSFVKIINAYDKIDKDIISLLFALHLMA